MSSLEAVTILFTDLVGSSAMASQLGPVAADDLRREHFAVLRGAIEATDGREVKNLGDGLMVAFTSPSAALRCATEMQQRIEHRNRRVEEQLGVRIGISFGEADYEDDDYFGRPVIEAARLCALAQGGQILTLEIVRMMVGERSGMPFTSAGQLELKGLPEPVEGFEVGWRPRADEADVPLPARLRGVPPVAYVGRVDERERIARLWDDAQGGARRVALLSGEPGIGKTRLATHAALEAHSSGAVVLFGRCVDDMGAPHGLWGDAVRHYVEHAPEEMLRAHVADHGGELSRLAPAIAARVPDVPPPRETDPETERYLLYGAVAGLLEEASRERPLVLVLDDLHWADKPSIALLKHVVTEAPEMRALVLGTYRDSDITRSHPLADLLADLRGESGVERIALDGLGASDVEALMEGAAGHELDENGRALAQKIAAETDGNPFFAAELLRHLVESGELYQREGDGRWVLRDSLGDIGMPQSVREVIGRRIERLGEDVRKVMSAAAVIGREFELELLARVVEQDEDDLLDRLESAIEAAVIAESAAEPGRFSFVHALFNHTLYEELGATRRARLHRRIAEALEGMCGDDPGPRLSELAHHWFAATTAVRADKALEYSRRAGERALAELAPDEAARWFDQALELCDDGDANALLRCDLLTGLGDAQRQTGEPDFRDTLLSAAAIAREHGDGERLALAALANNRGHTSSFGDVDVERIETVEQALAATDDSDPARRARLLSILALELTWGAEAEHRDAVSSEALALARRSGDEHALGDVIHQRALAIWYPHTHDERRTLAAEVTELAERLDDPILRFWSAYERTMIASEKGTAEEIDACTAAMTAAGENVGQPTLRWTALWAHASRVAFTGRLEEAEELTDAAVALGIEAGEPDALMVYAAQLGTIRLGQGRMDEVEELMAQSAEDLPAIPAYSAGLALVYAEHERFDEARPILDRWAADDFASIPLDQAWSTSLTCLVDVATRLGDARAAAALHRLLAPFEDQVAYMGLGSMGAIAMYLGHAAATCGRYDQAESHYARAVEVHERVAAPIHLARTWHGWGEALLARGGTGDADRGRDLLEQALATAREHGSARLAKRAEAALARKVPAA